MRAALALVLPVAACFTKPDPVGGTPPTDALVDTALDASRACAFDSFDMGLGACRPWGTGYGNATFSTANGELKLSLSSATSVDGGCFADAPVPFADGGIAMDVVEIPGIATGYVKLIAFDGAANPMIISQDGMILLTDEPRNDYAAKPYNPTAMHWWRLRPDRGAGDYIGETSPDGVMWTRLGKTSGLGTPASNVVVKLEAGVTAVATPAVQARIAEVQVCPP